MVGEEGVSWERDGEERGIWNGWKNKNERKRKNRKQPCLNTSMVGCLKECVACPIANDPIPRPLLQEQGPEGVRKVPINKQLARFK